MNIPEMIDLPFRTDSDGTIRIGGTRITLDVVIELYRSGLNAPDIAEQLDVLNEADIHLVIGYYLAHRPEVDAYLMKRDAEAEELRREIEASLPPEARSIRSEIIRAIRGSAI